MLIPTKTAVGVAASRTGVATSALVTALALFSVSSQAGFAPTGSLEVEAAGGAPNNAPTLTDTFRQGTPVLLNDIDPPGDLVAEVDDVYEDADGDPLAGAAVTNNNAPASEGEWQYSNNGGASWVPVPTQGLSDTNAILMAPGWRVRYVPAFGFTGAAQTIAGRVWDGNGPQTFGTGQNLTGNIGGTGGFSAQILDVTVTTINDQVFANGFE